jgi:hypothetical protein
VARLKQSVAVVAIQAELWWFAPALVAVIFRVMSTSFPVRVYLLAVARLRWRLLTA